MTRKKRVVVLTGAGISAESGLKTFRDGDGLWEEHRVEDVATPEAFRRDPELVLRFYNTRRRACLAAQPNAAHLGLVALEQAYEVQIITQNIDDLHERAGSTQVLHLHGSIRQMRSVLDEDTLYTYDRDIFPGDLAPDGGQLRPHVVWFNEAVPMIEVAIPMMRRADIVVLIGSSLAVYPAAGLLQYAAVAAPKYVIDKQIPEVGYLEQVRRIELPASQGIGVLLDQLLP